MNLAKRIIAVVGAPALLAGLMLAGSASVTLAIATPKLPDTIKFTDTVILGSTTDSLTSTSCTLTGAGGSSYPCFMSGTGTEDVSSVSITGNFGPISLQFVGNNCDFGSGVQAGAKVVPVTGRITFDVPKPTSSPNVETVKGTLVVRSGGTGSCSAS
jgi:hypothetical protein